MSKTEDMLEPPLDIRFCRKLSDRVALFNKQVDEHQHSQERNPFSQDVGGQINKPKLDKHGADYGRPVAGSKTDIRGQKALNHVTKEMLELCEIINQCGIKRRGRVFILFGELFNIYTHVSNKVVGLLLRARKHHYLDFEGETLFQRRDDDVPITLLMPIEEIRAHFKTLQQT